MKRDKKHNNIEETEQPKEPAMEIIPAAVEGEITGIEIIEWQAPEFDYIPKDVSWFWLSLLAAIFLVAFALWEKNFLFAVFVAIAWFVLVNTANRFPPIWEFLLDAKGLAIRRPGKAESAKAYAWEMMEGFDIHEATDEYKELLIKIQSRFSPYLKVNIHADHEGKIRDFLIRYIPEEEYDQSLADAIQRLMGF